MIILIAYIAIISIIKLAMLLKSKYKKIFVITASSLLFLLSACRHINFGSDTVAYVKRYISLVDTSLSQVWINFITGAEKDPFFYFISKLISLLGFNYQVWLAIIAAIFCFSVSKFIYDYSDDPYISFISLISLGYLYFSLSGLRQTIALSIILLSYKYLKENKLMPFIALVLFGSLFHKSAMVFLIAYPLGNMKIGWKQVTGIVVAPMLAYFFKPQVLGVLYYVNRGGNYSYLIEQGTTLNLMGFIIQLFIYLFCIFYKKRVLKSDVKNLKLYNLLFLGLIFQSFTIVVAEMFRVSMYFSIFSIALIPKAINTEKDRWLRRIVYLAVFVALTSYILWAGSFSGFKFFWE